MRSFTYVFKQAIVYKRRNNNFSRRIFVQALGRGIQNTSYKLSGRWGNGDIPDGITALLHTCNRLRCGNTYGHSSAYIFGQGGGGAAGVPSVRRDRRDRHGNYVFFIGSARFPATGACNKSLLYYAVSVRLFRVRVIGRKGLFSGQGQYVSYGRNGSGEIKWGDP